MRQKLYIIKNHVSCDFRNLVVSFYSKTLFPGSMGYDNGTYSEST